MEHLHERSRAHILNIGEMQLHWQAGALLLDHSVYQSNQYTHMHTLVHEEPKN